MHVVHVARIDIFSPFRPVSEARINYGVLASLNVIADRDPAILKSCARFESAAAQRPDVVDLNGKRILLGDEMCCIRTDANGGDFV